MPVVNGSSIRPKRSYFFFHPINCDFFFFPVCPHFRQSCYLCFYFPSSHECSLSQRCYFNDQLYCIALKCKVHPRTTVCKPRILTCSRLFSHKTVPSAKLAYTCLGGVRRAKNSAASIFLPLED